MRRACRNAYNSVGAYAIFKKYVENACGIYPAEAAALQDKSRFQTDSSDFFMISHIYCNTFLFDNQVAV